MNQFAVGDIVRPVGTTNEFCVKVTSVSGSRIGVVSVKDRTLRGLYFLSTCELEKVPIE